MLDNELITLIRSVLIDGLIVRGITGVTIPQKAQPTMQGMPSGRSLFIQLLEDNEYGFMGNEDKYDIVEEKMIHTETQNFETTFQINGFNIQNPVNNPGLTASDITKTASLILQSQRGRAIMRLQDVGIYKISRIRNPSFTDDTDRFEYSPSFDFTLTHKQVTVSETPIITSITPGIYPI